MSIRDPIPLSLFEFVLDSNPSETDLTCRRIARVIFQSMQGGDSRVGDGFAKIPTQLRRACDYQEAILNVADGEFSDPVPGKYVTTFRLAGRFSGVSPEPLGVNKQIDVQTGQVLKKPRSPIERYDAVGNVATAKLNISPTVAPDIEELKGLIESEDDYVSNVSTAICLACSNGELVQRYRESKLGRVQGVGHNLQNVKSDIRRVALDFWDLDIVNCHPTILYYYSGLDLPHLRDYIDDTEYLRGNAEARFDIDFKRLILRVLNGAVWGSAETKKDLGDSHDEVRNDPFIFSLVADIRKARKAIISNLLASKRGSKIKGLNGKLLDIDKLEGGASKNNKEIFSFFMYTAEQMIMSHLYDECEFLLLSHDGGIVRKEPDIDMLEAKLLDKTGVPFRLKVKTSPKKG